MYVIIASYAKDKNINEWKLLGYDSRPLRFTDYGTAERECMRLTEEDKIMYPLESMTYRVEKENVENHS